MNHFYHLTDVIRVLKMSSVITNDWGSNKKQANKMNEVSCGSLSCLWWLTVMCSQWWLTVMCGQWWHTVMWSVVATVMCGQWWLIVMCGQWWPLSCVVSGGSLTVMCGQWWLTHCHVWSVYDSLSCVVSGGSLSCVVSVWLTVTCGQCMTHCHVWSVVAHSLSCVVSVWLTVMCGQWWLTVMCGQWWLTVFVHDIHELWTVTLPVSVPDTITRFPVLLHIGPQFVMCWLKLDLHQYMSMYAYTYHWASGWWGCTALIKVPPWLQLEMF